MITPQRHSTLSLFLLLIKLTSYIIHVQVTMKKKKCVQIPDDMGFYYIT